MNTSDKISIALLGLAIILLAIGGSIRGDRIKKLEQRIDKIEVLLEKVNNP